MPFHDSNAQPERGDRRAVLARRPPPRTMTSYSLILAAFITASSGLAVMNETLPLPVPGALRRYPSSAPDFALGGMASVD
jgi:hypothetical protein